MAEIGVPAGDRCQIKYPWPVDHDHHEYSDLKSATRRVLETNTGSLDSSGFCFDHVNW
jgi:hypothetical protein